MLKERIITECKRRGLGRDQAAYTLATSHWETNGTHAPVKEAYYLQTRYKWSDARMDKWRKDNFRYYPYYGRGLVQLTWDYNYEKASKYFGVDFVNNPDWVMKPEYAVPILVVGMQEGWFTSRKLSDFIDDIDESAREDFLEFYNARRIVNGMDKANEIAVLAEKYEKELVEWDYDGYEVPDNATEKPVEPLQTSYEDSAGLSLLSRLVRLLIKVLERLA